jgi:cellulose synthase/poly-beta-1,6-N-acetylglucosamine synthase-like glycosyltransferase
MIVLLWCCLGLLVLTYVGYPVLMGLLAWLRPRPFVRAPQTPRVDVVLVVHDGAHWLEAKLANLRALDYPKHQLRINIVLDGCTDATASVARRLLSDDARVFEFQGRRGKSACIGRVLPFLDADLLLFTDVRQRLEGGAARALAAALADPAVGAASGELILDAGRGYGRGIDAYWRYEKLIRRFESASGSVVGVTGAIYAVRREALRDVPPGLLLDDMWIPLSIAALGYRVVFVPQAVARDEAVASPRTEELRKRRTLAGNYQLLHRWPGLAIPGWHPLTWRLWGHKWLRLLAPWLLLVAFLANAAAARGGGLYALLFGVQVAAYAMAALGRLLPATLALPPVQLCTAFASLNLSAALALRDFLKNPDAHAWQSVPSEMAAR